MATKKNQVYKCPFCTYKYKEKNSLYNHMETEHKDQLNGLSAAQVYFNYKYKKTNGSCIMCRKETKWNEATEKYERLCSETCRKKYRKQFQERMKGAGKDKQMEDPEHQKKMLEARKISGVYTWANGHKTKYVGSYERDFIEYLEVFFPGFNPEDLMSPAPQIFKYKFEGKEHFHIPDFYITSLNLIIQIKSGTNQHYRARDIEKEEFIDKVIGKSSYNYIKILDKDYEDFYEFILNFEFQ